MNLHDHEFSAIDGGTIRLRDHADGPILVVNTASECGTTPQYAGLQALHEQYADQGLTVIGVPSNDFGEQEPGDEDEIRAFCRREYGVSFPLTAKQHVIPPDEHPFYREIASELGDVARPQWNFHKYLVGTDGDLAGLWDSQTEPRSADIVETIETALEGGDAAE